MHNHVNTVTAWGGTLAKQSISQGVSAYMCVAQSSVQ